MTRAVHVPTPWNRTKTVCGVRTPSYVLVWGRTVRETLRGRYC